MKELQAARVRGAVACLSKRSQIPDRIHLGLLLQRDFPHVGLVSVLVLTRLLLILAS